MILDQLIHAAAYEPLSRRFEAALRYLTNSNLSALADGRYDVCDGVHALVQSYLTKPQSEGKWEAHQAHADIQLLISGGEKMGVAAIESMRVSQPHDQSKDVAFFEGAGELVLVNPGWFTIFWPWDVHMPQIAVQSPAPVKKVVMKVRLG